MSDQKKIYNKLPAVVQTPALKNFFESTVEQIFSKANVEQIQGYIGSPDSDDVGAPGKFLKEPTVTKRFYGLSPAVNTINLEDGTSENFTFYDELIDTLSVYGVDTKDHNKIFSETYSTFLPPVDIDKFINYQEYYWYPAGPPTINIEGTLSDPIDIDTDVLGQKSFTTPAGVTLSNGMIVKFTGEFVIPANKLETEYIVEGVGDAIFFVPKAANFVTRFSTPVDAEFDPDAIATTSASPGSYHSSANITDVIVNQTGSGYVTPELFIYDSVRVEAADAGNLFAAYPSLIENDPFTNDQYIRLERIVDEIYQTGNLAEYAEIVDVYQYRDTQVANTSITLSPVGEVSGVAIDELGENYSGQVKYLVFDKEIEYAVDTGLINANATVITDTLDMVDVTDIRPGQHITGLFTGVVKSVNRITNDIAGSIVLTETIQVDSNDLIASPVLKFRGTGFSASLIFDDMHDLTPVSVEIDATQARVGANPNDVNDYYLLGGSNGFDADLTGDGEGDLFWGGTVGQAVPDYMVQARGATNQNVWSRVNFWYHRDAFLASGSSLPGRQFRAERPIIEFDRRLDIYNHGTDNLGTITMVVNSYRMSDLDGIITGSIADGVALEDATFIFPNESPTNRSYVWTAATITESATVEVTGPGTGAVLDLEISGEGRDSYISNVSVVSPGSGYDSTSEAVITHEIGNGAEIELTIVAGEVIDAIVIEGGQQYYEAGKMAVMRVGDPIQNPTNVVDGQPNFVPLQPATGDTVQVLAGNTGMGSEYFWNGDDWVLAQSKLTPNQAPLFNLYDENGVYLGDEGTYPLSTFEGNKLFNYAVDAIPGETIKAMSSDSVLGFPLIFKQFKSSSEIVFENYQLTTGYTYTPFGGEEQIIPGYHYYKLEDDASSEYHSVWRSVATESIQRVYTTYNITQADIDENRTSFFIGGIPAESDTASGYDIRVRINAKVRTDFTYGSTLPGFIDLTSADSIKAGDFVEIDIYAPDGLFDTGLISKFELPLGWSRNPYNADVDNVSEPEYLTHLSKYMETQVGFEGDVLGSNNYPETAKDPAKALEIIQTNHDIVLGAYLLDDAPHNLVDAVRFNAREYTKYKNRIKSELDKFFESSYVDGITVPAALDQVIRNSLAYKVGREVFNRTYILPYGDNFITETFTYALDQQTVTLSNYVDLSKIENSMLVYRNNDILLTGVDIEIESYNPIIINFVNDCDLQTGDTITVKLFTENRDSAQCPPTPSTMGMFPLHAPTIVLDESFVNPVEVIIGHDGSRTPTYGDFRDDVLLELETRIYNAAKREFRDANSVPEYSVSHVRSGAFRDSAYTHDEWVDILRHNFSVWSNTNSVDVVSNEFFDENNPWTWNYSSPDNALPGHWKGLYNYYYDSIRPHTHPWELVGFTEKPTWWDEQYTEYTLNELGQPVGTLTYGSDNDSMWADLEQGIIRQGPRENFTNGRYLDNNPFRREGLRRVLPVDSDGNLLPPSQVFDTVTTSINEEWTPTVDSADPVYSYRTGSFLPVDGVEVSYDNDSMYVKSIGRLNHAIDMSSDSLLDTEISFEIPRVDLTANAVVHSPIPVGGSIGVLVNGLPLASIARSGSWDDAGVWHYDTVRTNDTPYESVDGVLRYNIIVPQVVGLDTWDTGEASPLVGWAFDGYPIYGPYGYVDPNDANSDVVQVRSGLGALGTPRGSSPGGSTSGIFVEDYVQDTSKSGTLTGAYNMRYAVTVDSPNEKIWHYVVTLDENGEPEFPYHVGNGKTYYGTAPSIDSIESVLILDQGGQYTYANIDIVGDGTGANVTAVITDGKISDVVVNDPGYGYTYAEAVITSGDGFNAKLDVVLSDKDNTTNHGYVDPNATPALSTSVTVSTNTTDGISGDWKFGDSSPAEQAWRYSEEYPYAVTESLLLAKPGLFATIFGDPTKLYRPRVDSDVLYNRDTGKRWHFLSPDEFVIHGDDSSGTFDTNIGYTQFIYSWIKFQGLDMVDTFVDKVRSLNIKLSHRMSGFIDKDTMVLRTDQYSTTGNATSLIIPPTNIDVDLHNSPYKSRNNYSGVIVEMVSGGYKVRGYDRTRGYFDIIESDIRGRREEVRIGGDPAPYTVWEPGATYKKGSIVFYRSGYYEARLNVTSGDEFNSDYWIRLPSLPQIGAATATRYLDTNNQKSRISYETVFADVQSVYDFMISLGRYHEDAGYDFGEYDEAIGDVRDWAYAAKQFLFWTTGKWEIGNTLELSPLATKIRFNCPRGFVAKINRTEREQFSIVDQNGGVVDPSDCAVIRDDTTLLLLPPDGVQLFGVTLHVMEIEHVLTVDNVTEFGDVIFDPVLNQKHGRLKIKASRTKNWTGKFLSEGFIIDNGELLPNPDNLAETMDRYYEFGFIPVEKQVYDESRGLFGYEERNYLRELDILDEQQFDFYRGMIQNKGTTMSLSRIARSNSIVQGNINVYDEWALKVGDFGDTDKKQSIELLLNKEDIVSDPQLITTLFPEDVTNIVDRIDVVDAKYTYTVPPTIELPFPTETDGVRAEAVAVLGNDGRLASIEVTNPGSGYTPHVDAAIITADVVLDSYQTSLSKAVAVSTDFLDLDVLEISLTLSSQQSLYSNVEIVAVNTEDANANVRIQDLVFAIANSNVGITPKAVESHIIENGQVEIKHSLILSGPTFEVVDGANVNIDNAIYEPKQRYAVMGAEDVTTADDITVSVDGVQILREEANLTYWTFDEGEVFTVVVPAGETYPSVDVNDPAYPLVNQYNVEIPFPANVTVETDNLEINRDGHYEFVELYINGIRVQNTYDYNNWYAEDEGNVYETAYLSGSIFTITENSIIFSDISRLPQEVLETLTNPPASIDVANGEQRDIFLAITEDTEIKIVEQPTIQFGVDFNSDIPGSTVAFRVTSKDGIIVRTTAIRNYEITADDITDDVITIDIDDSTRFLKKPSGIRTTALWATTSELNHTGMTDERYSRVRNSGYVHFKDVNYQAYDLGSLPDLFADDIVIKPSAGDLIHIAKSEHDDWNVYRLERIGGTKKFVSKNSAGKVNLYTDYSLFNYLDSNLIGEDDTRRYLDHYLTISNSTLSDKVVVWRNEDIVTTVQTSISDISAPRMVEAIIESIGPYNMVEIEEVIPVTSRTIQGLTLTPVPQDANGTVVVGGRIGTMADGDAVQLIDNVGTTFASPAIISSPASNTFVLNTNHVESIEISDAGDGYAQAPNVTITDSGTGRTAEAMAFIAGPLESITVVDDGNYTEAVASISDANVRLVANIELSTDIVNAHLYIIDVVDGGYGYNPAALPNVTVTGSANALVTANDIDDNTGAILRIRIDDAGSGYTASTPPTITIEDSPAGANATAKAEAVVRGNVEVTIESSTDILTYPPVVVIAGDGTGAEATAALNGSVTDVVMITYGAGYASTPNVTIDASDTGNTAVLTPVMSSGADELQTAINEHGLGNVSIVLTGSANAELVFESQSNIDGMSNVEYEALQNAYDVLGESYIVTDIDSANGLVTIEDVRFDSALAANIDNAGYTVTDHVDYAPVSGNVTYYTVKNVTATSFEIERPGTVASDNVMAVHLNNTKLVATDHGLTAGDVFRVDTNAFSGLYRADVVNSNEVIIDAPYSIGFDSGFIIKNGLEIKTAVPHGITRLYADQGKRVAVHFATPTYYNKMYAISDITPTSIIIDDYWPVSADVYRYFEQKSGVLNGSVPYDGTNLANATNIIHITESVKLNDVMAIYHSNNQLVPAGYISIDGDIAVIDADALPSDTTISVGITLVRQEQRSDSRFPLLTTVDHNKVQLNGSTVTIDSYNNLDGMATSLNRAIDLRREFTRDNDGGFGLRFAMMRNHRTPVDLGEDGQGLSAYQIGNYGPYLRDPELISELTNNQITADRTLALSDEREKEIDTEFNQGPIYRGPVFGIEYTDPETNVSYLWNPQLGRYVSSSGQENTTIQDYTPPAPEYHVDFEQSYVDYWLASEVNDSSIAYEEGVIIKYNDQYYQANGDITAAQNQAFNTALWTMVLGGDSGAISYNESLILRNIPGTGGADSEYYPGKKQLAYNMAQERDFGGTTLPVWRLKQNQYNIFEVYQAVQNDADDIYYIKVDESLPPTRPHNFYETVNYYSDFFGYPTTSYYYGGPSITVDIDKKITNTSDPVRLQNVGKVFELPPVEPAAYVGRQLIAEPFAVQAGNSTSAQVNFESLPELRVESPAAGQRASVYCEVPGYNSYLMWTPGLTPGKWSPTDDGPGKLPGAGGRPTVYGFGSGYYQPDDDHDAVDYPATGMKYSDPQPRFMYSKKFSVFPPVHNRDQYIFVDPDGNIIPDDEVEIAYENGINPIILSPEYVAEDDENIGNDGLRPEEIYVACFWTEPHLYRNQLVGFDYEVIDGNGLPTPIYTNYQGTVTRVKYIRLTELPENAFTRRIIPDTGWGGKQWENVPVDTVVNKFDDAEDMWTAFAPGANTVSGGSTGTDEEEEPTIAIVNEGFRFPEATNVLDTDGIIQQAGQDIVPVTEYGPVLTASVLEGLPGPCGPVPQPGTHGKAQVGTCSDVETITPYGVMSRSNSGEYNGGYYKSYKIAGNDAVRVFINSNSMPNGIGVTVVQSSTAFDPSSPGWWDDALPVLVDTQSNGTTARTNGEQIRQYGVDPITSGSDIFDTKVSEVFGRENAAYASIDLDIPTPVYGGDWLPAYNDQTVLGIKGYGLIQATADCRLGGFITIFVKQSELDGDTAFAWMVTTKYTAEVVNESQPTAPACNEKNASSRAYVSGATWKEWQFGKDDGRYGCFTNAERGERLKGPGQVSSIDNIYFPYGALPNPVTTRGGTSEFGKEVIYTTNNTVSRQHNSLGSRTALWHNNKLVSNRRISQLGYHNFTKKGVTVEIKGYFKAPYTGYYKLRGSANDGMWAWISSSFDREVRNSRGEVTLTVRNGRDDLSGDEYFTEDGYSALPTNFDDYMRSKRYHRDNYAIRTGWLTTNERDGAVHTSEVEIKLEAGKYYFTRIIAGNRGREGFFNLEYLCYPTNTSELPENLRNQSLTGRLSFSGRTCPVVDDSPIGTPATSGSSSGGGSSSGTSGGSSGGNHLGDTAPSKHVPYKDQIQQNHGCWPWPAERHYFKQSFLESMGRAAGDANAFTTHPQAQSTWTKSPIPNTQIVAALGRGDLINQLTPTGWAWYQRIGCQGLVVGSSGGGAPAGGLGSSGPLSPTEEDLGYDPITEFGPSDNSGTGGNNAGNGANNDTNTSVDTPVVNPAPGQNPANNPSNVTNPNTNTSTSGGAYNPTWQGGPRHNGNKIYSNFSGYSQREMTGYNFMPTSFKVERRTVVASEQYGYSADIAPGRYTSATHQRISGGLTVPFARQLDVVDRTPRALENTIVTDQPWSQNLQDFSNLNQTVRYVPAKVSSTYTTNSGEQIRNITTGNNTGGSTVTITGPAYEEPAITVTDTTQSTGDDEYMLEPLVYTRFDNENIRYTQQPLVDITPMTLDGSGKFVAAGPTARASVTRPTPSAIISRDSLIGIQDNSELFINGRKIIIRGTELTDIKTQVNCANMGIKATILPGLSGADNQLLLSSCSGAPWTVANGCAGGRYKQVGDFHINRGFDQSVNTTRTVADQFLGVNGVTVGNGNDTSFNIRNEEEFERTFRRYVLDEETKQYVDPTIEAERYVGPIKMPAIMPTETITTTTTYTTGGSGYRVGDRLRLVGGTPVNNTKAPITKVCIDNAGAGFTNPANLQVVFNETGSAPGIGAAAQVTKLDANGGIAEIEVASPGGGYDLQNPPSVTIIDSSPTNLNVVDIDAAWPEQVTVDAGDIVRVAVTEEVIGASGSAVTEIVQRYKYVRATAPVTFGQDFNLHLDNYSFVDSANSAVSHRPRMAVTVLSPAPYVDISIRPNMYVELTYMSLSETQDNNTTVVSKPSSTSIEVADTSNIEVGYFVFVSSFNGSLTRVAAVDTNTNIVTLDNDIMDAEFVINDPVFFGAKKTNKFWVPQPKDNDPTIFNNGSDYTFYVEDNIISEDWVNDNFSLLFEDATGGPDKLSVTLRLAWWNNYVGNDGRPSLVDTIDPSIGKIQPQLSVKIGVNSGADYRDPSAMTADDAFEGGYRSLAGPLRVAKFIVTSVDEKGAITSLKAIDRGLYKVFPSDLTYGVPLEYDYELQGASQLRPGQTVVNADERRGLLGIGDPARDNALYGTNEHPEYWIEPFKPRNDEIIKEALTAALGNKGNPAVKAKLDSIVAKVNAGQPLTSSEQDAYNTLLETLAKFVIDRFGTLISFKHPDWATYPEFYWDGKSYQPYYGSPGAYDPSTFVISRPDLTHDPIVADAWQLLIRKNAVIDLDPGSAEFGFSTDGTPGGSGARVFLTSQEVPDCSEKSTAKESLQLPDVVTEVDAPASLVAQLNDALVGAGYDPDELSFTVSPIGDISVVDLNTQFPGINIDEPTPGFLPKLGIPTGTYNLGMLCIEGVFNTSQATTDEIAESISRIYDSGQLGVLDEQEISRLTGVPTEQIPNSRVLSLLCVDLVGDTGPTNDNLSIFNNGTVRTTREMYKYDITNVYGDDVTLPTGDDQQSVDVSIFASKRYESVTADLAVTDPVLDEVVAEERAWVDNYNGNGWAYLENGVPTRVQEPLVDLYSIKNAIIYDGESGRKTDDLDFWDPFKGIIPAFIDNEIHFVSDSDPASYNDARTGFGRQNIGKVWWDTSTVVYTWYEQGTTEERAENWARAFPGSSITICEWVESKALPENWTGNGSPRFLDRYVTERRKDPKTGNYEMFYYYWVQNRSVVDDRATRELGRKLDTQTLARYIANPVRYGLNLISFIDDRSMLLYNMAQILDSEENRLQVNFSRNTNPNGLNHTAWKLLREEDSASRIPQYLTDKLIDSLVGYNAINQEVPDPRLSEVEKYGISVRPRQTMFKDIKEARRVLFYAINEMLANYKLTLQYPLQLDSLLAATKYISPVDWYAVKRIDPVTNLPVRYDSSYKPVFTVSNVADLKTLRNIPDGTVAQVQNGDSPYELWLYVARDDKFIQIAIESCTVRLNDAVYLDDTNAVMAAELRELLIRMSQVAMVNNGDWNRLFFALMKYAYVEQKQLDWAFKTSYLYVDKQEHDLVQINGFKPDNFDKVQSYLEEVKPYNSKIREYKDSKYAEVDTIGQNAITDTDFPPYIDPLTGTIRILDINNPGDAEIMRNDPMYTEFVEALESGDTDRIRKIKTTIEFDRTNWRLTEFGWDKETTTIEQSMANNIVEVLAMTNEQMDASDTHRAVDRIFKYTKCVQDTFDAEMIAYFGDDTIDAKSNVEAMLEIIEANGLNQTFELVKELVGGNFRGMMLDGGHFNDVFDLEDYKTNGVTEFGYQIDEWDTAPWDTTYQINSYVGKFVVDTDEVNLVFDGEKYEGFDGVTFQRVAYGSERPEELALIDPKESLIMTVTTSDVAQGNTAVPKPNLGSQAAPVKYRIHNNLFGGTDYYRVLTRNTIELTEPFYIYSEELTVNDASILTEPSENDPGKVWVGTELVYFGRREGNTLSLLVRGALGTTAQNHEAGTQVYVAEDSELFNNLNPERAIWLDLGEAYVGASRWDGNIGVTQLWDELEANAISTVTEVGNVTATGNTTATIEMVATTVVVGEGVRVYNTGNTESQVVIVTAVNGNTVDVEGATNPALFIVNDTVNVDSYDYGAQDPSDYWDAATKISGDARSLADRSQTDFTDPDSIMRFLHDFPPYTP